MMGALQPKVLILKCALEFDRRHQVQRWMELWLLV
jgi:hypothetical protein